MEWLIEIRLSKLKIQMDSFWCYGIIRNLCSVTRLISVTSRTWLILSVPQINSITTFSHSFFDFVYIFPACSSSIISIVIPQTGATLKQGQGAQGEPPVYELRTYSLYPDKVRDSEIPSGYEGENIDNGVSLVFFFFQRVTYYFFFQNIHTTDDCLHTDARVLGPDSKEVPPSHRPLQTGRVLDLRDRWPEPSGAHLGVWWVKDHGDQIPQLLLINIPINVKNWTSAIEVRCLFIRLIHLSLPEFSDNALTPRQPERTRGCAGTACWWPGVGRELPEPHPAHAAAPGQRSAHLVTWHSVKHPV